MQRYHNETILSSYNTRAAQRRREHMEKTQEVLESYELKRNLDDAFDEKHEQSLNEDFKNMAKSQVTNSKVSHDKIKNKINYFNEYHDEICKDLFFFTVYESLLIDNEIKSQPSNFNYIRESANKFFDNMNKNNALSIKEGSAFNDIMDTAVRFLNEEIEAENGVDVKNIIKKTILSEDMLMFFATESIKLKTAECLNNEKKGAIIKENLSNEDKYIDPSKSLFRYLFESNIQDVIEKSDEQDPDHLQDLSMVETILDYTILESANTLQLVNFSNNIKNIINKKR